MRKKLEKEIKAVNQQKQKYGKKLGRNDKCPCGSGKKYKYCCMNKDKGYL